MQCLAGEVSTFKMSMLWLCIVYVDVDHVVHRIIFRSFVKLLDLADAEGSAPLHLAEEKGMYSKVEVLLEFGAG